MWLLKRIFLILVLFSLTFALTLPVLAVPPVVVTFHNEGSFVAADCGDFLALEDFVEDVTVTIFFDREGNRVRVQSHVNFDGIVTNSVTGLTLRDPGNYTIIFDLQEGTFAHVGIVFAIRVPGEGIAVLDAGNVVVDADGNVLFEGGPHQFLDEGPSLICAALD